VNSTIPKQPNPLVDLALTVALPSFVLGYLSEPNSLGPFWALIVSLLFPLGYGFWCWSKKVGWNAISILGFVTVLLSGGLGLLQLDAFWFAIKESSMIVMLGIAFPISDFWGKPLINALILQPQLINLRAMNAALDTNEKQSAFKAALHSASWKLGLGMIASSVANFFLAMYLLGGKQPGSEAFVKGIGTLNWASNVIIGLMLMAIMLLVFLWLLKQITSLTGLEKNDLLNPGRTVRRQVTRE